MTNPKRDDSGVLRRVVRALKGVARSPRARSAGERRMQRADAPPAAFERRAGRAGGFAAGRRGRVRDDRRDQPGIHQGEGRHLQRIRRPAADGAHGRRALVPDAGPRAGRAAGGRDPPPRARGGVRPHPDPPDPASDKRRRLAARAARAGRSCSASSTPARASAPSPPRGDRGDGVGVGVGDKATGDKATRRQGDKATR